MGYLINNKIFISTLTAAEVKDCRARALWLAETHFQSRHIDEFDLGNLLTGYMTAEVTTSYIPGQRRIWYYVNKVMVYTQRIDSAKGVRRVAEDYFAAALKLQQGRERERRQIKAVKELA